MNNKEIVALEFFGKRTGQFELRIASDNPFGYVSGGIFTSRAAAKRAARKA